MRNLSSVVRDLETKKKKLCGFGARHRSQFEAFPRTIDV
jgi:hypothetical protein